jgi:hypothetical protein
LQRNYLFKKSNKGVKENEEQAIQDYIYGSYWFDDNPRFGLGGGSSSEN